MVIWLNNHIFGKVTKNAESFEYLKAKNKNF